MGNEIVTLQDDHLYQIVLKSTADAQRIALIQDIMMALSENTKTAYRKGINSYLASGRSLPATSAEIADYVRTATAWQIVNGVLIQTQQRLAINTLRSHVTALSFYHKCLGLNDPCNSQEVKMALKAQAKQMGTDVGVRAKALMRDDIVKILKTLRYERDPVLIDLRDASILLVGFTAALRRSEITALQVDDLEFTKEGCVISLRRSKYKNYIFKKGIALLANRQVCPVTVLKRWLTFANITSGYVFRSIRHDAISGRIPDVTISERLKILCGQAGIPITERHSTDDVEMVISGHSLRAGFVTECRQRKIPDWVICRMTGHKDIKTLATYTRVNDIFDDNASHQLWE